MKKMKKVFFAIIITLFTANTISYAETNKSQTGADGSSGYGALYNNTSNNSGEQSENKSGGLFRSDADNPGGRPDNGDAIGQETPVKGGLNILIACCFIFGIIKLSSRKEEEKN